MTTANERILIPFGQLVFNGNTSFQDQQHLDDFCKWAISAKLEPLLHFTISEQIQQPYKEQFKKEYLIALAKSMIFEHQLNQLKQILKKQTIRFTFIKGADLAFNAFPSPAIRTFNDIDLLLHPDDTKDALQILKDNGWEAPYFRAPNPGEHHFPPFFKDKIALEPHWTLPNFKLDDPKIIWEHIAQDNNRDYRLSNELNLLLVARHAASEQYRHLPIHRILLDAGYIAKNKVDWNALKNLASTWNLPAPQDLFAVWESFFPKDIIAQMAPNKSATKAFEKIFALKASIPPISNHDIVMHSQDFASKHWLKERITGLHPKTIRAKYKLPPQGNHLRLLAAYAKDITAKASVFCKHIVHRKPDIAKYNKLIELAENQSRNNNP